MPFLAYKTLYNLSSTPPYHSSSILGYSNPTLYFLKVWYFLTIGPLPSFLTTWINSSQSYTAHSFLYFRFGPSSERLSLTTSFEIVFWSLYFNSFHSFTSNIPLIYIYLPTYHSIFIYYLSHCHGDLVEQRPWISCSVFSCTWTVCLS